MKDVIVSKFGGSSLADSKQFAKVKNIIKSDTRRRYIIPSAPGRRDEKDHKITDLLYMCYQLASHNLNFDEVYEIIERRFEDICIELGLDININENLLDIKEKIKNGASKDYVASRGEYLNAIILSHYLNFEFVDAKDLIVFDNGGQFDSEATQLNIQSKLNDVRQAVIPGFYGARENGEINTFSRGGSDITGAIIARAIDSKLYENWTDVSGFLIADPKIVNNPKPIEVITYRELRELSYMGAPVLHEEAIFPVKQAGISINIKNTNFPEEPGTMIVDDLSPISYAGTITGIAGKKDFTVISIEKTLMSLKKDFYRKLLTVLETNNISIEHMPSSIDSVSLIISNTQLNSKLEKVIEEISIYCSPDSIIPYPNMALIAVVGRGMIRTKGISGKIFMALANKGVNIRMITQGSSELNIIIGVENDDFNMAIAAIYEAFES
ncbi:aspartate kinase [Anaerosalibacter massiliensis]|uniref:Aspartokinase n=1 Tax=Anaerosalibacter massiliensis TaxID=1347392 RepID=A0A9X2S7J0_9FIRM|nr:aspartate kinase [Anaerosalibacter massiliensis]MCR2044176.1 aspartate kinase [Anaerosalibacter massiliensis]